MKYISRNNVLLIIWKFKNKKLVNEDIKNLTEKCEILEKEIEVIKNGKYIFYLKCISLFK